MIMGGSFPYGELVWDTILSCLHARMARLMPLNFCQGYKDSLD